MSERFNSGNRSPHTLLCGHSLCRKCVLGLPTGTFPGLQLLLPYSISCPWCKWLTPRLLWKGVLAYPAKNFSLMWLLESLRSPLLSPRSPPPVSLISMRSSSRATMFMSPSPTQHAMSPSPTPTRQGQQGSEPRGSDDVEPWQPDSGTPRWGLRTNNYQTEEERLERATQLTQEERPWNSVSSSLFAYAVWFERQERSWVSSLGSLLLCGLWFLRKLPYVLALLFLIMIVAPIPTIILGSFFAIFSTSAILVLPCSFSIAAVIMFACRLVQEMRRT